MKREELITILTAALLESKAIKSYKIYQKNKGLQILTNDGSLFNILPIDVTDKGCSIITNR